MQHLHCFVIMLMEPSSLGALLPGTGIGAACLPAHLPLPGTRGRVPPGTPCRDTQRTPARGGGWSGGGTALTDCSGRPAADEYPPPLLGPCRGPALTFGPPPDPFKERVRPYPAVAVRARWSRSSNACQRVLLAVGWQLLLSDRLRAHFPVCHNGLAPTAA